jgi:AraC family ethanolamine operon transcriptional activator
MFAVTLTQTSEARWMGQPVGVDDMLVQRCGTEADYFSAPFWDMLVLTIPEAELARQIVDITHDDPGSLLHTHGVVHLTPQLATQVRQAALHYIDTAVRSMAKPDAPSPLPQMAKSTVELMARILVSAQPQRPIKASFNRQRQLIHDSEDYCRQHTNQPLRIGQLCHELDISERSMRDAFNKLVGMSPLSYLKAKQLNRVYSTLRQADPAETLIKQIAYNNGFRHMGQFTQNYKHLFGEVPSETLQRY